jgi:hypothetical protein
VCDRPLGDGAALAPATQEVNARSGAIATCFFVLGVWALVDIVRLGAALPWRVMYDFQDFYCAGEALDRGESPYTYEPLRSCEHRLNSSRIFQTEPAFAVPAPQPAYDFLPFMALARLDPAPAQALYATAIVAAVLLTALLFSQLYISPDVALAALLLSTAFLELNAGQIVPFALLFLVLTGITLAQRRNALAGAFGALTAIEPHVGTSVLLSLLLFVPRARWSALVTAGLLAVAGLSIAGMPNATLYVTRVLPAQAAAEVSFPYQYSLTFLLHFLGAGDDLALGLGTLAFLAFLIAGLGLAPKAAAALQRRELLVFIPAAAAVMPGAYVHMVELCFAIPAALVIARWVEGRARTLAIAALCMLAIPWIIAWSIKKLFVASIFVCVVLLYRLRAGFAAACGLIALLAAFLYVFQLRPPALSAPALPSSYPAGALVQTEWQAVAQGLQTRDARWVVVKIPTWCALGVLLLLAADIARRPRFANDTPLQKT